MTPRYAERTNVAVGATRNEIERLLDNHGAKAFVSGWDRDQKMASVMFDLADRRIRFSLRLPDPNDRQFTRTPTGRSRTAAAAARMGRPVPTEHDQAVRQRWRALLLVIKAKLEAITAGIATVDEEFLAYIVIPGTTSTVSERVGPELARSYEVTGYTPMLALPGGRPEPATDD
jgi:hypothetical protein